MRNLCFHTNVGFFLKFSSYVNWSNYTEANGVVLYNSEKH